MKNVILASVVAVALVICSCGNAVAEHYRLTDLGTLGHDWVTGVVVNESGQMAVTCGTANSSTYEVYQINGTAGPVHLFTGEASGLNNAGQICGWVGQYQPVKWTPGVGLTYLEQLSGSSDGWARAINDTGSTVGCVSGSWNLNRPILWATGSSATDLTSLASPGNPLVDCYDINNLGQVAGYATDSAKALGFVWTPGVGVEYFDGEVRAIDEQGTACIEIWANDRRTGRVQRDGSILGEITAPELGSDGERVFYGEVCITDMNEAGSVVGFWDDEGSSHPYIWTTEMGRVDLPMWTGENGEPVRGRALGVNDSGVIVGIVDNHAVVWEPLPEPSSLFALLCGLGSLAGLTRRRA